MKKVLYFLRDLLPHLLIAGSVLMLTCCVLNNFNKAMKFINNSLTAGILPVFCLLVALMAAIYIAKGRKRLPWNLFAGATGVLSVLTEVFYLVDEYSQAVTWMVGILAILALALSVLFIRQTRKS